MAPRASTATPEDAPAEAPKTPPALPTEPTRSSADLAHKTVVIYGPPGVGKSTLASQWGGGGGFFFNTAGELGDFEVLQQSITSWDEFRQYAWAVSEAARKEPGRFPCWIIDTADVLGRHCSEKVRTELKIAHESDLEYGVGWSKLRDTWAVTLAKLVALPSHGLVFVTHADEKKVKTRSAEYDKWQMRGVKSIREYMLDTADLVLFVDYSEDDTAEGRVIKTKPSRYWDAKERGTSPRLPAEIEWPIGTNGWDLINGLWQAA